jgi:hypothetical protein
MSYRVRLDWGPVGAWIVAVDCDVAVVVDVRVGAESGVSRR